MRDVTEGLDNINLEWRASLHVNDLPAAKMGFILTPYTTYFVWYITFMQETEK